MDTKQPEALGGESVRTRHCQQHNHGAAQYVQISFKALEKYVGQQADVADVRVWPQGETCEIAQISELPGNGARMAIEATATAFLTVVGVDELCAPLTQRHAQNRRLCALLVCRAARMRCLVHAGQSFCT